MFESQREGATHGGIYGKLRKDIGTIIRQLCAYKDVEIIEGHAMPRSYTYFSKNTTKDVRFKFYGIFEREKQFDDI